MTAWDDMVLVGRIARPHGHRGQVIVNPDTDFPEDRFAPPVRELRPIPLEPRVLETRRRVEELRFERGRVDIAVLAEIDP